MKKLVKFLLIGMIAVMAASCGGGAGIGSKSPADIEKAMLTQLKNGNYEKAVDIMFEHMPFSDEERENLKSEEGKNELKGFVEKMKLSVESQGGIKSFEILEENIDESGETATVRSHIVFGNGQEDENTNKYTKVDGKWNMSMGK
jgi:hypothetical protein